MFKCARKSRNLGFTCELSPLSLDKFYKFFSKLCLVHRITMKFGTEIKEIYSITSFKSVDIETFRIVYSCKGNHYFATHVILVVTEKIEKIYRAKAEIWLRFESTRLAFEHARPHACSYFL